MKIDVLVSMLDATDVAELELEEEAALCGQHGIAFLVHPIADFGLPDKTMFRKLVRDLAVRLRNRKSVAVHCRAGIGRSGMVVSSILVALGMSAKEAIATVSEARGVPIPDTEEQRAFIEMLYS